MVLQHPEDIAVVPSGNVHVGIGKIISLISELYGGGIINAK